jgi:hypothetical protein
MFIPIANWKWPSMTYIMEITRGWLSGNYWYNIYEYHECKEDIFDKILSEKAYTKLYMQYDDIMWHFKREIKHA